MLTEQEIRAKISARYPRTEKEKEGCPEEMQRMYNLRKAYREKLIQEDQEELENQKEVG